MWIKCPICNGTGRVSQALSTTSSSVCPTCNGGRIISELSGKPPTWQGDMPMESQQEYFGINKKFYYSGDFRDNCEQFEGK